jgi:hypothetical protein
MQLTAVEASRIHLELAQEFSQALKEMEAADLLHLILLPSERGLAVALSRRLSTVLMGFVHLQLLGRNLKAQGLKKSRLDRSMLQNLREWVLA